jgi:hypothetical protein
VSFVNRSNLLCAIAIALVATGRPLSANLIVNPGFETGDFSGWTTSLAASGSNLFVVPNLEVPNPRAGNYAVSFGADGADLDAISQTFATTPGTRYNLGFWLEIENFNNEFRVTFGGITLLDLIDKGSLPGRAHYRQFTFSPLAKSSSTTLEFAGRNPPNFSFLDDVSVTPSATVTDSGSIAMLFGVSAAALLLARMHFRRIT